MMATLKIVDITARFGLPTTLLGLASVLALVVSLGLRPAVVEAQTESSAAPFETGTRPAATLEVPTNRPAVEAEPVAEAVTVPFIMLPSNHMAVRSRINDRGSYWLIFDLGAPVTLLSTRASKQAGVVEPNRPASFLFGMTGEEIVDEVQLGEATVDDLPVIVMDHPALNALSTFFIRIDGIVGYTFFARYRTTIDYQAKTMTFAPTDNEARNLMEDLPAKLTGPKQASSRVLAPTGLWGLKLRERTGLDDAGVTVALVIPGSPADRAGIEVDDVLAELDGRWTLSVPDAYEAAAEARITLEHPGVPVTLLRDGKPIRVTITPRPGI